MFCLLVILDLSRIGEYSDQPWHPSVEKSLFNALLLYPLRYFDNIWLAYISGQGGMLRARTVALFSNLVMLSHMNNF